MPPAGFKFGEFEADRARFQLRRNGGILKLEPIPLKLLFLLAEKDGSVVTRREIIDRLWGNGVFVDTNHGINTAVKKLRQVLGDDPDRPRFVETVSGRGYRFIPVATPLDSGNGHGSVGLQHVPTNGSLALQYARVAELEQPIPVAQDRKPRRARWQWIALGAAVAALVLWLIRPAAPAPKITRAVPLTSDGRGKFPMLVTDGVRIYFSERRGEHWTVAVIPVSGGEPTQLPLPFPDALVAGISADKSDLLIREGEPFDEHPLWRVPILAGTPRRMPDTAAHDGSWSPDGKKLAYMRGGDVYLAKADGSDGHKISLPNPEPTLWAWFPRWSPDGSRIRFERYFMPNHTSTIWEASSSGDNPHPLLPDWQRIPMQCCGSWIPGGAYFVFDAWHDLEGSAPLAPAPDLWALREKSSWMSWVKREPVQLTAGPVHFLSHVISGDGKTIFALSTQRRGELTRYDVTLGKFSPYLPGFSAAGVSFSRDGTLMAYVKYPQGELWRSKADGSEALQLTHRPLMASAPHWSPDGKQIVFAGQEPGAKSQLRMIPADGGSIQLLSPESDEQTDATWFPQGKELIFATNDSVSISSLKRLNLETRQVSVLPGSSGMFGPSLAPDGRRLCAVSYSGSLSVLDFNTQKWTTLAGSKVEKAIWSKSGDSIYFVSGGSDPGIFHVDMKDHTPKKLASLKDFQIADTDGIQLSLSPAGEPLLLRETGLETEVYALDFEAQ